MIKVACDVPSICKNSCGIRTGCSSIAHPVLVLSCCPEVRGKPDIETPPSVTPLEAVPSVFKWMAYEA
ncbi:hypothetical protein VULLAG_LOCUS18213 [Vulpes lagopus]